MTACPQCGGTLGIARRIVLPGDRRSDEIALETIACACGFKAVAVTEQLRRAALRGGASERVGYRLPQAAVDLLDFLIARCPHPAEEFCGCPAHAALNRRDLRNQWNLLQSFAPFPGFAAPAALAAAASAVAYAPLDWTRNGDGYRATVEGREWRLYTFGAPNALLHELSVGGALGLDLDALPPFWRLRARGV
ncbi:MAG TPA: hypothetical protein VIF14_18405 [Alphaproteobacteria bacterium]|jgi:hypothetical protein